MKHSDFTIGTEFQTSTGQRWRCTDVGTRTILAIELKPDLDESWFNGPPYAIVEVPFDECDMAGAYRNIEEAVQESIEDDRPGFPHEVVMKMARARIEDDTRLYPHKKLLRVERVSADKELLHPYAVKRRGETRDVLIYRPLLGDFIQMAESEFVRLPMAKG